MAHDWRASTSGSADLAPAPGDAAGKRTRTQALAGAAGAAASAPPPVLASAPPSVALQLMLDEALRPDLFARPAAGDALHQLAAAGTRGAGEALPHGAAIGASFGRHADVVDGISAHVGGAAADAAAGMGAEAFATGDHVAFRGAPSLHTAAHEAAHVVQQRAGVHLLGGVGEAGDRHEHHADAVADRVVAGASAEDLLDAYGGGGGGAAVQASPAVQCFHDPARAVSDLGGTLQYIKDRVRNVFARFRKEVKAHGGNDTQHPTYQALLVHQPVLAAINQEAGLPGAIAGQYVATDIADIVRLLNQMEQENRTAAITEATPIDNYDGDGAPAPQRDIKIGTEFSFCHADLRGIKVGQESEKKAHPHMQKWAAAVTGGPRAPVAGAAAKAKSPAAVTFTYDLDGEGTLWSWTLDVDEGCLETQTLPSTLTDLRANKRILTIIEKDIFEAAANLGLIPDTTPQGGGGHISLDAATTFGGSAEVLLVTLLELQNNYGRWQAELRDDDTLNAPWLAEMDGGKKGKALQELNVKVEGLLARVHAGELDFALAVAELKHFNQTLKNPIAEELRASKDPAQQAQGQNVASNPDHYQAVNVEHLDDAGPSARIELRRISAQTGPRQLFAQLEFIFGLIQEVRDGVAAAQRKRLGG